MKMESVPLQIKNMSMDDTRPPRQDITASPRRRITSPKLPIPPLDTPNDWPLELCNTTHIHPLYVFTKAQVELIAKCYWEARRANNLHPHLSLENLYEAITRCKLNLDRALKDPTFAQIHFRCKENKKKDLSGFEEWIKGHFWFLFCRTTYCLRNPSRFKQQPALNMGDYCTKMHYVYTTHADFGILIYPQDVQFYYLTEWLLWLNLTTLPNEMLMALGNCAYINYEDGHHADPTREARNFIIKTIEANDVASMIEWLKSHILDAFIPQYDTQGGFTHLGRCNLLDSYK